MKKLVLASMLAAFTAAVALPAFIAPSAAVAAVKKKGMEKTKMKTEKKKKPTGKM